MLSTCSTVIPIGIIDQLSLYCWIFYPYLVYSYLEDTISYLVFFTILYSILQNILQYLYLIRSRYFLKESCTTLTVTPKYLTGFVKIPWMAVPEGKCGEVQTATLPLGPYDDCASIGMRSHYDVMCSGLWWCVCVNCQVRRVRVEWCSGTQLRTALRRWRVQTMPRFLTLVSKRLSCLPFLAVFHCGCIISCVMYT